MAEAAPTAPQGMRPMVEMRGIVKTFGHLVALDGVDVSFKQGEIHALLGENGAGKTTLMNVLFGLHEPDAGELFLEGQRLEIDSPEDAMAAGIGMVHQHFMLVPTLTVAENVLLGTHGPKLLRRAEIERVSGELAELGERYGMEVNPSAPVWQLSVGEQQRVEIIRALHRQARVLILDEPTAMLTPSETEVLFPKLQAMARQGVAIIFITHHLEDVIQWADEITVLRLGSRIGEVLRAGEASVGELARLMVGRDVDLMRVVAAGVEETTIEEERKRAGAGTVLEVKQVSITDDREVPALEAIDISVAAGEIHAVIGVEGNGQAELEEALFGLRRPESGSIELCGQDVTTCDVADRLALGLGLIPSDRYRRGVISGLSVAENLVYDRIDRDPFGSRNSINKKAIQANAEKLIEQYSIRVPDGQQRVSTLSGGNAQRVVLARTLRSELNCVIASQPTRGLDVGAIQFTWQQLLAAREEGLAILLISTDLDEVMCLADRCSALFRGRIIARFDRSSLDRDQIGLAIGGVTPDRPGASDDPAGDGA